MDGIWDEKADSVTKGDNLRDYLIFIRTCSKLK